jgi:hypothetical protein
MLFALGRSLTTFTYSIVSYNALSPRIFSFAELLVVGPLIMASIWPLLSPVFPRHAGCRVACLQGPPLHPIRWRPGPRRHRHPKVEFQSLVVFESFAAMLCKTTRSGSNIASNITHPKAFW